MRSGPSGPWFVSSVLNAVGDNFAASTSGSAYDRSVKSLSTNDKILCGIYGAFAAVALVATWWNNLAFFNQPNNGGLVRLIQAGYANYATSSLTNDLFLVFLAALVFMVVEGHRIRMRLVWVYVLLGTVVAISVGFPLYLLARQIKLAERRVANPSPLTTD